jgi:GNAT superfamily N-acetyltransferase
VPIRFAEATADDLPDLARLHADAFAAYRAFAPDGWLPPSPETELRTLERWLGDADFFALVARTPQGALAGDVTLLPAARHRRRPVEDPALGHIGDLFVVPAHWGTGLASDLLGRAAGTARSRGFTALRLFVVEGQARARRFYEREGFACVGGPIDLGLGLPVLEYRRSLAT